MLDGCCDGGEVGAPRVGAEGGRDRAHAHHDVGGRAVEPAGQDQRLIADVEIGDPLALTDRVSEA